MDIRLVRNRIRARVRVRVSLNKYMYSLNVKCQIPLVFISTV